MPERRMVSKNFLKSSIAWKAGELGDDTEGLAALSVFLALILIADDFGNGRYIPQMILIEALGSQPKVLEKYTGSDVERWVQVFVSDGAIVVYEVEGQKYFSLTGWDHYQKGNWRPAESSIPPPPRPPFSSLPSIQKRKKEKRKEERRREEKRREENSIMSKVPPKVPDKSSESNEEVSDPSYTALTLELLPHLKNYPVQLKRNIKALDALIRIDHKHIGSNLTPDAWTREVFAVLRWARRDVNPRDSFPGWSAVFQSISRLRPAACEKFRNMRAAYRQAVEFPEVPDHDQPTDSPDSRELRLRGLPPVS